MFVLNVLAPPAEALRVSDIAERRELPGRRQEAPCRAGLAQNGDTPFGMPDCAAEQLELSLPDRIAMPVLIQAAVGRPQTRQPALGLAKLFRGGFG